MGIAPSAGPDTNLVGSLHYGISHYAIYSHAGEHEREDAKAACEAGKCPFLLEIGCNLFILRAHVEHRQIWVNLTHCISQRRQHGLAPHLSFDSKRRLTEAAGTLPIRAIVRRLGLFPHPKILGIAAHAHNLHGVGMIESGFEGPADRIEMGIVSFCQALTHHRYVGRSCSIAWVESPSVATIGMPKVSRKCDPTSFFSTPGFPSGFRGCPSGTNVEPLAFPERSGTPVSVIVAL